MRIKLVENVLGWLGVPSKNAPEYDVGIFNLNQPLGDYIDPGNDVPVNITLKNFGLRSLAKNWNNKLSDLPSDRIYFVRY